jgi:hypothetical protein
VKVYQFNLKRHDVFELYDCKGVATLTTDEQNPYPCTNQIWSATNCVPVGLSPPDKFRLPSYFYSGSIENFLLEAMKYYIDNREKVAPNNSDLYLLIKQWDHALEIAIGWGNPNLIGAGTDVSELGQKIVDSLLRTKAFW